MGESVRVKEHHVQSFVFFFFLCAEFFVFCFIFERRGDFIIVVKYT